MEQVIVNGLYLGAQVLGRRHACGHDLAWIFVLDFIQRKRAQSRQLHCALQSLEPAIALIEKPELHACSHGLLGAGGQFQPARGKRPGQADGGQHVVQRLALARMHLHASGGHHGHVGLLRYRGHRGAPRHFAHGPAGVSADDRPRARI